MKTPTPMTKEDRKVILRRVALRKALERRYASLGSAEAIEDMAKRLEGACAVDVDGLGRLKILSTHAVETIAPLLKSPLSVEEKEASERLVDMINHGGQPYDLAPLAPTDVKKPTGVAAMTPEERSEYYRRFV